MNGKESQNPNKPVVAATFEWQKLSFLPNGDWDREVGGSNPLAPTNRIKFTVAVIGGRISCRRRDRLDPPIM
jgi:hypothetical protein